jgi:hypothetical protein
MDQHEETWLVQLANGAVRVMTLDELDAAFQEGTIDEETFVRRDGASKWSKLRDELAASEPPPPPAPAPMVTYQVASYSVRPVVSEIDTSEFTDSPFAKKSKKGLFVGVGLAAAAAVAIGAFGATKLKNTPAAEVNASVANAVQAPQAVTPPPPVDPVVQKPALSEDQKKALAEKDTQFNQKMDQKKKDRAHKASLQPTRGKTSPPPFSKNGSAYDPLNAKL